MNYPSTEEKQIAIGLIMGSAAIYAFTRDLETTMQSFALAGALMPAALVIRAYVKQWFDGRRELKKD